MFDSLPFNPVPFRLCTRTMTYDWSCLDWLNRETQRWRYALSTACTSRQDIILLYTEHRHHFVPQPPVRPWKAYSVGILSEWVGIGFLSIPDYKGTIMFLIFTWHQFKNSFSVMLKPPKRLFFFYLHKVSGVVSFKCESVATLDPVTFDTPESFVALSKWTAKKAGSISFDFRTTEPNGLMLFSHGKPRQQQRKDPRTPPTIKVKI